MDVSEREELNGLVEKMTHSGSPSLDEAELKKLKRMCRSSDGNVRATYDLVMSYMAKKHAEVRLSAFQITAELFPRSHLFRQLVISNFQRLAELVTGTESKQPLPPPQTAATRLKETSLLAIRQWNEKFGEGYPTLKLGYNHLKHSKKVDFDRLVAQTEAVRRRNVARDAQREAIARLRLSEVHAEMADQKYDIESCLRQMESCFDLLLPRFDVMDNTCLSTTQGTSLCENVGNPARGPGVRDRILSSGGSFASLESTEDSESEAELEREGTAEQLPECSTVSEAGSTGTDQSLPNSECRLAQEPIGEDTLKMESQEPDTTEERGKGKGRAVTTEDSKCGGEEGESWDVSSDESDVEWLEVDSLPTASLAPLQQNGFVGRGVSIAIQLPVQISVEETEDNASVVTALSESHRLLQDRYLPTVNRWLEWLTKAGEEADLKEAIDIKSNVLTALDKYKRLNISIGPQSDKPEKEKDSATRLPSPSPAQPTPPPSTSTTDTTHTTQLQGTASLRSMDRELEQDPTTIQAQLGVLRRKSSGQSSAVVGSSKGASASHSDVPVVPFDMDLYHWDNPEGNTLVNKVCMSSVHQYWGSERDIELCDEEKARLKCRTIQFAGKFEPVKWSCRAPLPSGKLCPRRDRLKCPFHGPIIARDEQGHPSQTSSSSSPNTETHTSTAALASSGVSEADYNDIEAAVFAAKGIELPQKGKGKKGKRGRKKYPGLTDLAAHDNTPRRRLEKRIFSKRAVKKVADAMDVISARRFQDKFGDTFNYALKK